MRKRLYIWLIVIVIVSNWLLPPIISVSGSDIKLDDIIILFIMPLLLLKHKINTDRLISLLFIFIISIHVSYLIGILNYYETNFSQYFVILRYWKILIFCLFIYQINFLHSDLGFFAKLFRFINIIIIILGLAQYFYPSNMIKLISSLYANEVHFMAMFEGYYNRVTLTAINPNAAGVLLLFGFLNELSSYIYIKKLKISSMILMFLNIIVIFFTSSRTAIICLCLTPILLLIAKKLSFKNFLVIIFSGGIMVLLIPYFEYIQTILYLNQSDSTSVITRTDVWKVMIDKMELFGVWVFGFGPGVGFFEHDFDNEYVLLISRFGLAGLVVIILILIKILINSFTNIIQKDYLGKYGFWIFSMTIFSFVIMVTNVFLTNFQIVFSFFLLIFLLNSVRISKI